MSTPALYFRLPEGVLYLCFSRETSIQYLICEMTADLMDAPSELIMTLPLSICLLFSQYGNDRQAGREGGRENELVWSVCLGGVVSRDWIRLKQKTASNPEKSIQSICHHEIPISPGELTATAR